MAPRNTRNGATAAKRASARSGARSSSSSRSRGTAVALAGVPVRAASPGRAVRSASRPNRTRTGTASSKKCPGQPWERWWVLPLAVVALLALFVWSYYPVARVQYRETRERARLEAELAAVQARNARLRAQVARLRTPEGVEDYARSQLGMVKRGEHVAMVIDGDEAAEASAALAAPVIDSDDGFEDPVGPWTGFLDVVFGVQ